MNPPILESDLSDPRRKTLNPALKFALELGPGLVFFFTTIRGEWLAQKFPILTHLGEPLLIATAFFMVATALSLAVSWLVMRSLPIMPLVSGIIVFGFGALALWLQDKTFAYMKPTIINSLFGLTLLGGLAFGRSLLGYVFDSAFSLDAEGWRKLTMRWALFFLALAVINEIVWRTQSTDTWVNFKSFGVVPLTFVFAAFQFPLLQRHAAEPTEE